MLKKACAVVLAAVLVAGCASDTRTRDAQSAIAMVILLAPLMPLIEAGRDHSQERYFGPMPEAKPYPGDDVPLYRGVTKTPEILKAETEFLKKAERTAGSRAKAAESLRWMGIEALWKDNFREASVRLNQSWLLDPEQSEVYERLAVIAWDRDRDGALAEELFKKAHEKSKYEVKSDVPYGALLVDLKRPGEAIPWLRTAAEGTMPSARAQGLLVIALDETGDRAGACRVAAQFRPMRLAASFVEEVKRHSAGCPVEAKPAQ
jgi:Flp pilus assembly protein TadD